MFNQVILLAALGIATATDLYWRRIPNALTGSVALIGLVAAAIGGSSLSIGYAFAGLLVGLALMLPGHFVGATGAGDVKLVAAIGALVGPSLALWIVFYTAIAGGVLALAVAMHRGRLAATLVGTASLASGSSVARDAIVSAGDNRFPYAPAIAIGTLVALMR